MKAELTQGEMESIAEIVSKKLLEKAVQESSLKMLNEACEKRVKEIIKFYLDENSLTWDVRKMIAPILDTHLKETNIINQKLGEFMNTEEFKKLEIKNLEDRIRRLRIEIEEDYDNN